MKNDSYYPAYSVGPLVLIAVIALSVATAWGVNFYKFTKCDFSAPYKGEVIHGMGLVPALSIVTVWFNEK